MKDAFFTSSSAAAKRKRPNRKPAVPRRTPTNSTPKRQNTAAPSDDDDNDEISDHEKGPSNIDDMDLEASEPDSEEEELEETAAEKRVRLAKAYLDKIQDDLDGKLACFAWYPCMLKTHVFVW